MALDDRGGEGEVKEEEEEEKKEEE